MNAQHCGGERELECDGCASACRVDHSPVRAIDTSVLTPIYKCIYGEEIIHCQTGTCKLFPRYAVVWPLCHWLAVAMDSPKS